MWLCVLYLCVCTCCPCARVFLCVKMFAIMFKTCECVQVNVPLKYCACLQLTYSQGHSNH